MQISQEEPCQYQNPTLFFRCTKSGLKEIQCPSGLAFDLYKQTCDWKAKVTNCDEKESKSTDTQPNNTIVYSTWTATYL